MSFSPAPGPTLKRPCATLVRLLGCRTNTSRWPSLLKSGGKVGSGLLLAAQGLRPHHKTKLPNVGSASHHQPKQMTWNPTNHNRGPSTANKPTTAALLIQTSLLRANFRKSSEITFGLLDTPSWQRPRDDAGAASINCRPSPS